MSKKPTIVTLAAAVLIITGATFSDRVFASSTQGASSRKGEYAKYQNRDNVSGTVTEATKSAKKAKKRFQGVVGVVSSINGTNIVLTGKDNTVYVVDASGATIRKGSVDATTTLAQVQSGDHLFVRGTVTGTSVIAVDITDGKAIRKAKMGK